MHDIPLKHSDRHVEIKDVIFKLNAYIKHITTLCHSNNAIQDFNR